MYDIRTALCYVIYCSGALCVVFSCSFFAFVNAFIFDTGAPRGFGYSFPPCIAKRTAMYDAIKGGIGLNCDRGPERPDLSEGGKQKQRKHKCPRPVRRPFQNMDESPTTNTRCLSFLLHLDALPFALRASVYLGC